MKGVNTAASQAKLLQVIRTYNNRPLCAEICSEDQAGS